MRGTRRSGASLLLALGLGLTALGACALLNAGFGPMFADAPSICDRVLELHKQAAACEQAVIVPFDQHSCVRDYECLQYFRAGCDAQMTALLDCLQAEHACEDLTETPRWLPFCQPAYDAMVACAGKDNVLRDCDGVLAVCGDGFCDVVDGEDPEWCPEDCADRCDQGHYSQLCVPYKHPGACLSADCSCLDDEVCDPLTENGACPDCDCDGDRVCELGESTYTCPMDCYCDFDGRCGPTENPLGCPDCPACPDPPCELLGESCGVDTDCAFPMRCIRASSGGSQCKLPCEPDNADSHCPPGATCDPSSKICT